MTVHALRPYALLLLRKGDNILLIKRQNTGFEDGSYSLIGGKVEPHETFRQAVTREAAEEVGIDIDKNELKLIHTFQREGAENELIALIFEINECKGEPYNKETNKASEIAWFSLNNLPTNIIPAHKQALELIKKNINYSEHNYEKEGT